ncbi:MAG: tetratricopeptide repeat protein [Bacillota bacterium]|nr:tetratricopeptide repeat protein [Bacillota bacterium]
MIRLLEHEDDIYLNSFIETVRRHIDAESFFDQGAYALLRQVVVPEIESRLVDLLIGLDKRASRQANLAEDLFRQGYEHERGLFCDQDYTKASGYYVKAASFGITEASYRLGWLLENELVQSDELRSCDDYYRQAVESGNAKAIVATGQRLLFNAVDQIDIRSCLTYFKEAERADWPYSAYYLPVLEVLIHSVNSISHEQIADQLKCFLPIPGHQPKDTAIFYNETTEADIRLAKYCHQHSFEEGTFFLSWCHLTGLGLPKDHNKARKYALQFANTKSPDLLLYIAWIYLSERTTLSSARAVQYIRAAADRGLSAAQLDWTTLTEIDLLHPESLIDYLNAVHEQLEIEKWF